MIQKRFYRELTEPPHYGIITPLLQRNLTSVASNPKTERPEQESGLVLNTISEENGCVEFGAVQAALAGTDGADCCGIREQMVGKLTSGAACL